MGSLIQQRQGEGCDSASTDCWTDWWSFTVCGFSECSPKTVDHYNKLLAKTTLKQTKSWFPFSCSSVHYPLSFSLSSLFFHFCTPFHNTVFPNYLNVFLPAWVFPSQSASSDLLSFYSPSWPTPPPPLLSFSPPHFIFLAEQRTFPGAVTFLVLN